MVDLAAEQLNIETLFGKKRLEAIQRVLHEVTGLAFVTIDYKGTPITELTGFNPICKNFRSNAAKERICQSSDAFGSISSAVTQKPFVYVCPCGLLEVAFPLIVGEHYLGGFIGGQIKASQIPDHIAKLASIYQTVPLSDGALFEKMPKMPFGQFMEAVNLIAEVLKYLVIHEVKKVQSREEEMTFFQKLSVWNQSEAAQDDFMMLMEALQTGDFQAMYYTVPKFIRALYLQGAEAVEVSIRSLRQIFLEAVGGVDLEDADDGDEHFKFMMRTVMEKLSGVESSAFSLEGVNFSNPVTVEYWLFQAFDFMISQRFMAVSQKMQDVWEYMNRNLKENIGIPEIIDACDVSQAYLSRTFRQYFQTSVMNYLHMKKIYLAKVYFTFPDVGLSEVTFRLGYNEASYFTKVFKKYEKMTMTQFKALNHYQLKSG